RALRGVNHSQKFRDRRQDATLPPQPGDSRGATLVAGPALSGAPDRHSVESVPWKAISRFSIVNPKSIQAERSSDEDAEGCPPLRDGSGRAYGTHRFRKGAGDDRQARLAGCDDDH